MTKYLTQEQIKKLKEELNRLKTEERLRVAERIKTAKEFGDLSENAEYAAALEEQKELERRIFEIETILKEAKVVKSSSRKDVVEIGCQVEVEDLVSKKRTIYQIVSSGEENYLENKITPESPIGKCLLGRKVGEIVEINLPKKQVRLKIISIQ